MKLSFLIFALLALIIIFYFVGYAVATLPFRITIVLIVGFIFAALTLIDLQIGLYLLIFVVPFTQQARVGSFVGSFHAPVDIGTDDIFIVFILLSWLANLIRRREPLFLKTPLNWPIIAFFTAAILSFVGSPIFGFGTGEVLVGALHLFKFFEYVVVYFVVISTIENLEQIKKFLKMFFVVTALIAIVQVIAMATTGHFSLSTAPLGRYSLLYLTAMYSFVSNAILGAYYIFFVCILLALILYTPASEGKIPLILFCFFLSYTLFNTFSRSAYVGLLAGFFVLATKEKRFFLILLLFVVLSPIYMESAVLERITFTIQSKGLGPIRLDESSTIRLFIWKKAIEAFWQNPFFGLGYWGIRYYLHNTAHSQYLNTLAETGIVGFSAFSWMLFSMLKNATNLMKKAESSFFKALGLGYTAGLVGVLVSCIFSENLEAYHLVGPIWFVTGLITSANRLLSEKVENSGVDST